MPKKILIIDDEEGIVNLVKRYLEAEGFDVVASSNGNKAIELIQSTKPDLLLLDINMPGINGFTILNCIRSPEGKGFICPVVIITGEKQLDAIIEDYEIAAVLYKPFELDELTRVVGEALES